MLFIAKLWSVHKWHENEPPPQKKTNKKKTQKTNKTNTKKTKEKPNKQTNKQNPTQYMPPRNWNWFKALLRGGKQCSLCCPFYLFIFTIFSMISHVYCPTLNVVTRPISYSWFENNIYLSCAV